MPRIRYSAAVRERAVRLVLESQKPLSQVAKKFGCSVSALQNWLKDRRQRVQDQPCKPNSPKSVVKTSQQPVAGKDISRATFIPIHLIDQKSTSVEIVTPAGFTLKFSDVTPQYIAELLRIPGSC